jgi:signal transduction histidine kinase
VVPVVAGAEEVGHIAVLPRPGFPLTRGQRRLIDDLARQSALALSNARLTAQLADQLARVSEQADELRASRQRLVVAQDEERRRLERDIHDGAQQQLVAVTLQLRAAAGKVPEEVAPLLEAVREQVADTISTLRTLARGVFPPLLAEAGLAAAVRAHIGKTRLPIHLDDRTAGRRFAPETEAALYFCCLEALQNATKHAGPAATVTVLLTVSSDGVCAEVRDDGPGFDPADPRAGAGLVHMADRLAAVDGELRIVSAPGAGAVVRCWAPA